MDHKIFILGHMQMSSDLWGKESLNTKIKSSLRFQTTKSLYGEYFDWQLLII